MKVELPNGGYEILLTSLLNEKKVTVSDMKQLYAMRWKIETSFFHLKHKAYIENFTGKSVRAIQQDFYLKIFLLNLTAIAVAPVNETLEEEYHDPDIANKGVYMHQVNYTEAFYTVKESIISLFYFHRIKETGIRIWNRIKCITEPIRERRSFERNHRPKRKHYMTLKPV